MNILAVVPQRVFQEQLGWGLYYQAQGQLIHTKHNYKRYDQGLITSGPHGPLFLQMYGMPLLY
jgi:hypothetical protein